MVEHKKSRVIEEIKGLLWALVIALFIRTFLFQPFNIPSSSMYPTLMIGDFLFVSKYSFGFSRYSLPFMPNLFSGRIWDGNPTLGEVIVFTNPNDPSEDWIKRLVGRPGDRVQVIKGILHINGEAAKLERLEDYEMKDQEEKRTLFIPQYMETLPNGVQHKILKMAPFGEGSLDNTPEYLVPADHYFFMGDNRDNSGDSRLMGRGKKPLGFVPKEFLLGPARVIFFSTEAKWYQLTDWFSGLRPTRFFNTIG